MEPEPSIEQASVVALILHGVGDHSPEAMMQDLIVGFKRAVSDAVRNSTAVSTLNLDFLLPPGAPLERLQGLWLQTPAAAYCLIPIVWSGLRPRYCRLIESFQGGKLAPPLPPSPRWCPAGLWTWLCNPLFGGVSLIRYTRLWIAQQRDLRRLSTGVLRCSKPLFWRFCLALLTPVLQLLGWLVYALPRLRWVWVVLSALALMLDPAQMYLYMGVANFIFLAGIAADNAGITALDNIADVLSYVEDEPHRKAVHELVCGIAKDVRVSAPDAHLFVAGHSLGSVVVTHALLGMQDNPDEPTSVRLITFGSPLNLMSRVFGRVVMTVSQLQKQYAASGLVRYWLHLWRDSDIIGRSLRFDSDQSFRQISLGDGPHWAYWSDPRLWTAAAAVSGQEPFGDFDAVVQLSSNNGLSWEEASEFNSLQKLWLAGLLVSLTGTITSVYCLRAYLAEPDAPLLLGSWMLVLQTVCRVLLGSSIVMGSLWLFPLLWVRGSDRSALANFRMWRHPVVGVGVLGLVTLAVILYGFLSHYS